MCCSWDCCHHISVVVVVLPLSRSGCDHAAAVILLSHSEPDRAAVMIVMSRVSGDLLQKIYCCFAAFSFSLLLRPTIVEFYGFFWNFSTIRRPTLLRIAFSAGSAAMSFAERRFLKILSWFFYHWRCPDSCPLCWWSWWVGFQKIFLYFSTLVHFVCPVRSLAKSCRLVFADRYRLWYNRLLRVVADIQAAAPDT